MLRYFRLQLKLQTCYICFVVSVCNVQRGCIVLFSTILLLHSRIMSVSRSNVKWLDSVLIRTCIRRSIHKPNDVLEGNEDLSYVVSVMQVNTRGFNKLTMVSYIPMYQMMTIIFRFQEEIKRLNKNSGELRRENERFGNIIIPCCNCCRRLNLSVCFIWV